MDFIAENYLWIILIIIIVLMAIVGYIAEKTEFIKKTENPGKLKVKEKKTEKEQPIVIEDKGIDELLKDAVNKSSEIQLNNTVQSEMPLTDDIMSPLVSESPIEDNGTIDESLFAPLEQANDVSNEIERTSDFTPVDVTPLQDIETSEEIPVINEEEDIWKF